MVNSSLFFFFSFFFFFFFLLFFSSFFYTNTETLFDVCLGTNMIGCSAASFGCSMGEGWISCQNKDISGALHLNDDMSNVTHIYLHKNKSKRIYFFCYYFNYFINRLQYLTSFFLFFLLQIIIYCMLQ